NASLDADTPRSASYRYRRSFPPSETLMRFAAVLAVLLSAASVPALAQASEAPIVSPVLLTDEAHDPWTFAEPEVARVTHVALDLTLDFAGMAVGGKATPDVQAAAGG